MKKYFIKRKDRSNEGALYVYAPDAKGRLRVRPEYFLRELIRNAESVVSLS
jgi:hypothetical protein